MAGHLQLLWTVNCFLQGPPFGQKGRWSEKAILWSEGALVRGALVRWGFGQRCVSPKGLWSEGSLVRRIVCVLTPLHQNRQKKKTWSQWCTGNCHPSLKKKRVSKIFEFCFLLQRLLPITRLCIEHFFQFLLHILMVFVLF